MSDRLERFLGSTKRRYFLGFLGAGLALGLGVLATNSSLSAKDLKVPKTYNASKEWVANKDQNVTVKFFNNSASNAANFTSSYEATSGFVYLTLDNAKWSGEVNNTALCKAVNDTVATYYSKGDNDKTIIYTINSSNPIAAGITYFFSNKTCNGSQDMTVTILNGTTSNVKVSVKIGNNNEGEADLIALYDQWKIKEIKKAKAYINSTNNTAFKIDNNNNVTSTYANGTIEFSNTTSFDNGSNQFNATVALDKFPSWLKNATSNNTNCFPNFNASNYTGASANNCDGNQKVVIEFHIKGNANLAPDKISLNKYEIKKVDGSDYTKDLLSAYSGDKTLLEVLDESLNIYIPRFDHRKEGNPKTYVNLATTKSGVKVRVCKFGGSCYDNDISLDKEVKNLFQRESAIEDFLGGYSGALKLEFINLSDPSELVCYTIFIRGDGTVVRVPCLKGSGVEVGAN